MGLQRDHGLPEAVLFLMWLMLCTWRLTPLCYRSDSEWGFPAQFPMLAHLYFRKEVRNVASHCKCPTEENIRFRVLSAFVGSALGDAGVPAGLGLPWWGLQDGTWLKKKGTASPWQPCIPPSSPCRTLLRVFKLPIAFSFLNLKKPEGIWLSDHKVWLFFF